MSAKQFNRTMKVKGYKVILRGADKGFGDWAEGKAIVCKNETDRQGLEFHFACKHFEEGSQFGIDNGRISKLGISMVGENESFDYFSRCLVNYDRKWDITLEDTKKRLDAAYAAILKKFN